METRNARGRGAVKATVIALLALAASVAAAQDRKPSPVRVDPDGTVLAPAMSVPVSSLLSPEAKAYMAEHLRQMQQPELLAQKDGVPIFMESYLARQRVLFPHPHDQGAPFPDRQAFRFQGRPLLRHPVRRARRLRALGFFTRWALVVGYHLVDYVLSGGPVRAGLQMVVEDRQW